MATLNDLLQPTRIADATTEWSTVVKRWPNGRTTKKRNWASGLKSFTVEWDGISLSDYQTLEAHFNAQSGQFGTFQFVDTRTNITYNVQYDSDKLKRSPIKANINVYKVSVTLQEVK